MSPQTEISHTLLVFRGEQLRVRQHAIDRLIERWPLYSRVPLTEETALLELQRLLNQAEPEVIDPAHKVIRMINNGFREASYWKLWPWRFVTTVDRDGVTTLLTAEIIVPNKRRKIKAP